MLYTIFVNNQFWCECTTDQISKMVARVTTLYPSSVITLEFY